MKLGVFSLNLHGYHPMGEVRRFIEDREGRIRPAGLYPMGEGLHFFTREELDRGHRRRLDRLGHDLARLGPDVVCLQEVAAGSPWTPRDCEIFHHDFPEDWFEGNGALRLLQRMNAQQEDGRPWQAALACRGNIGWRTGPGVFSQGRVVSFSGSGKQVIQDFDANPYPEGLLVEDFAILVRQPWALVDRQEWNLTINSLGHKVFVQAAMVRYEGPGEDPSPQPPPRSGEGEKKAPPRFGEGLGRGPWLVLANVHLGHKFTHFEQAVALRSALRDYRAGFPDQQDCLGMLIAGDYNAYRYRPADGIRDVAMIPWEVQVPGQFDFRPRAETFGDLLTALWACNDDHGYKPWASLRDQGEASRRIGEAAGRFWNAQEQAPDDWPPLVEGLDQARGQAAIFTPKGVPTAGAIRDRIDFIYADAGLRVESACVVYPENTFSFNTGTSDHPAILVNYEVSVPR